jgi:cell division cycle 14
VDIPTPFKNVLSHFASRNIGLVVRLNSELYSSSYFTALGVTHKDMIFDDGTCPSLSMVRTFINMAHEMITVHKRGIAVHCKAGLGRTGCLIGAYLIYRHGFTANEIIAYMRFMRPGMVVGPQQHWLHLNQGAFREWWFEDTILPSKLAALQPATPTRANTKFSRTASNSQTFTPPGGSQRRAALGEITSNAAATSTSVASYEMEIETEKKYSSRSYAQDENLPAPTPGQPRKTSKAYGVRSPQRDISGADFEIHPDAEVVTMRRSRHTQNESESEEEFQLRMLARRTASRSPASGGSAREKRRAVSCTTTTVTTWGFPGTDSEGENLNESLATLRPKTPARSGSGVVGGKGDVSVGKMRSSPLRRSTEERKAGVRKTSGRVGSMSRANAGAKAE